MIHPMTKNGFILHKFGTKKTDPKGLFFIVNGGNDEACCKKTNGLRTFDRYFENFSKVLFRKY